jgi:hypothetical protein
VEALDAIGTPADRARGGGGAAMGDAMALQKFFDAAAEDYDRRFPNAAAIAAEGVRLLDVTEGCNVLELGRGDEVGRVGG